MIALSAARRDMSQPLHTQPYSSHLRTFSEWILNWENVSTFMKCLSLSFYCGFFLPNSFQSPHLFRCFFPVLERQQEGDETQTKTNDKFSPQISIWQLASLQYVPRRRIFNNLALRRSPSEMFSFHCFDIIRLRRYLRLYWMLSSKIGRIDAVKTGNWSQKLPRLVVMASMIPVEMSVNGRDKRIDEAVSEHPELWRATQTIMVTVLLK